MTDEWTTNEGSGLRGQVYPPADAELGMLKHNLLPLRKSERQQAAAGVQSYRETGEATAR